MWVGILFLSLSVAWGLRHVVKIGNHGGFAISWVSAVCLSVYKVECWALPFSAVILMVISLGNTCVNFILKTENGS